MAASNTNRIRDVLTNYDSVKEAVYASFEGSRDGNSGESASTADLSLQPI